ncbi:hypothetical protein MMC28_003452 [Mycoblastus sanguinarius]|nr:hypothetical protein [Mycoblastus sanguinarius]
MYALGRLVSITISYSLLVAIAERAYTLLTRLCISKLQQKSKDDDLFVPSVGGIEPLRAFNFRTVDPIKYRPFETKRHVTMGIKESTKQDWIRIDRNYLDRMNLRRQLLSEHPEVCLGNGKISNPAILELYEEIVLDLLPKRYPTMFRITGDVFANLVTGFKHRISEARLDHTAMLRHLAENVEEDFYFMVPNALAEFELQGFVSCFPQGLLPAAKVGMSVAQIHEPVPGYEGRLKKGVNRCFERMAPGQSVGRLNWAIQSNHADLYLPFDGANTLKTDDSPSQKADVNPSASYLRVEHHTLTCLPRTGTIVFAVRSYLTPLTDIRNEGAGPSLADACESMPEKFGLYKNRSTWGPKICSWLREDNSNNIDYSGLQPTLHSSGGSCPFSKTSSEASCPFAP